MIKRKEKGDEGYVLFAEKASVGARFGMRYQSNSKLTRLSNLKQREQTHFGHFHFESPKSFILKYTPFPEYRDSFKLGRKEDKE